MITTEDIQRLIKLKAKDKEAFYRLLDELRSAHPLDLLLSYARFKEYEPNVSIARPPEKSARAKAVRSKP
ncbi:MAG TPA: hypothetical protein VLT35_00565 [Methanocella sp.]|nr:hypothetical protein [Methanocella sp.]